MLFLENGRLIFDAPITAQEYLMHERVSLGQIFQMVFDLLRNRPNTVVYGSQALNAYVKPPRMTEDIDIFTDDARVLAEEICRAIHGTFHVAVRIRRAKNGVGLRIYTRVRASKSNQTSKDNRRHLIDVRPTEDPPPSRIIGGVAFVEPGVLAAMKVLSANDRGRRPEGLQDIVDLKRLLARFPALRAGDVVVQHLHAFGASAVALELWARLRTEQSPTRRRRTARSLSYRRN